MAKKMKKKATKPRLADDIRASLEEAVRWARGEKTHVIIHTVIPSESDARRARHTLGLSANDGASRFAGP